MIRHPCSSLGSPAGENEALWCLEKTFGDIAFYLTLSHAPEKNKNLSQEPTDFLGIKLL